MADDQTNNPRKPLALDYRNVPSRLNRAPIWWALAALGTIACVMFALLSNQKARPRDGSLRYECQSNLKNIAAAMIVYSNTHQGIYPASMEELMSSSGMTSAVLVCPASRDTQATMPAQMKDLSVGGHCSYIYLAKGLTSQASDNTVLVYEPLKNHNGYGMNLLFGDYHVEWLSAAEGQRLIASIVPGNPTVWPPPAAVRPAPNAAK